MCEEDQNEAYLEYIEATDADSTHPTRTTNPKDPIQHSCIDNLATTSKWVTPSLAATQRGYYYETIHTRRKTSNRVTTHCGILKRQKQGRASQGVTRGTSAHLRFRPSPP